MARIYSAYQAKARFSEVLRRVRAGETVFISLRGREVAEIRPVHEPDSLHQKIARLEAKRIVWRAEKTDGRFGPIARRPGGLERFLGTRC